MTFVHRPAPEPPEHFCPCPSSAHPEETVWRCDCGKFWLRKAVICEGWVAQWIPVRWYHRAARRRIKNWSRAKSETDFRFPVTSLLTTTPSAAQTTLTNKVFCGCAHCGHVPHPGQDCPYRRELPGETQECGCADPGEKR